MNGFTISFSIQNAMNFVVVVVVQYSVRKPLENKIKPFAESDSNRAPF